MLLEISVCTFQNGTFDVMFRDKETGKEVTFTGAHKLSKADFEFVNDMAPACVWTTYQRITPADR